VVVDNEKDKEKGMFKTQEWIVVAVDSKKREVTLSRSGGKESLDWVQFNSMFEYAFAITVHKCQGIVAE
jgi:ATP-dependent exoDNAse (exonuclease V) alpha subunit